MPSYKPPAAVASAARRALDIRAKQPPSRRAGTPVGIRRAAQLAARQQVSIDTIKSMVKFFARHAKLPGSAKARRDQTSKAAQAWGMWGGNAGRSWARRILKQQEPQP